MPITVAHPAAVLPLRRVGVPMAGMVIGSMVPDVPLFLSWSGGYRLSHSFLGVLTVDLAAALIILYAWNALERDAVVDLAPNVIRLRLPARHRLTSRQWTMAPVAVTVGSVTHVVWDAFTHPGRWGVTHLPWLRAGLGPLPMFKWAQYASGVIGMAVLLWAVIAYLGSREAPIPPRHTRILPAPLLPVVLCVAAAYGLLAGLSRWSAGLHEVGFHGVVQGIIATVAAASATCAVWMAARLRAARSAAM
jgi:hypothetical protein